MVLFHRSAWRGDVHGVRAAELAQRCSLGQEEKKRRAGSWRRREREGRGDGEGFWIGGAVLVLLRRGSSSGRQINHSADVDNVDVLPY